MTIPTDIFFEAENRIEEAILNICEFKKTIREICTEIKDEFNAKFVNIQLVRPEAGVIETVDGVMGEGTIPEDWLGLARHYLEPDPKLQDIQATIARTCQTEIIAGWDKQGHFDKWIYREYEHYDFIRVFTPIIVIQDEKKIVDKNWFENKSIRLSATYEHTDLEWFKDLSQRETLHRDEKQILRCGQHVIAQLHLPKEYAGRLVKVIGTVEVGYDKREWHDPIQLNPMVNELVKLVGKKALKIRKTQLSYVLDVIVRECLKVAEASGVKDSSASLHFFAGTKENQYIHRVGNNGSIYLESLNFDSAQTPYIYEVIAGKISSEFLKKILHDTIDDLTKQAVKSEDIVVKASKSFIIDCLKEDGYDKQLKSFMQECKELGAEAVVVYPLQFPGLENFLHQNVSNQKQENSLRGFLYIYSSGKEKLENQRIRSLLEIFANRAIDAIQQSIAYERSRDREKQLETLQIIAQSLATILNEEKLLNRIAWNIMNLLAADNVIIYNNVVEATSPIRAGRFIDFKEHFITNQGILSELFEELESKTSQEGIYIEHYKSSEDTNISMFNYLKKENIKSYASVLLKAGGGETVGVIFINYRRHHNFSNEEKKVLKTLASSSASAISQQRWLQTLNEIARKCINATKRKSENKGARRDVPDEKDEKLSKDTNSLAQKEVLAYILKKATQMTGAEIADIRLIKSPASNELVLEACYPQKAESDTSRIEIGSGITGWVANHRKSELVFDVSKDERYIQHSAKQSLDKLGSELCVPLLDGEKLLGVLNVESNQLKAFNEKHLWMLKILADRAVIAIQLMRAKKQSIATETLMSAGYFTYSLRHGIRAQCSLIRDYVEKIKENGNNDAKESAKEIEIAVQDIDAYSELVMALKNNELEAVNICEVIDEGIDRAIYSKNIKNIDITNLPNDLPEVFGKRQLLKEVFYNLIQNAKEAMPEGGNLSIKGEQKESKWVEIRVIDRGEGISLENQESIFELGVSSKKGENRGIGLWFARTYIQELGGDIEVLSEGKGKGAEFRVVLPL